MAGSSGGGGTSTSTTSSSSTACAACKYQRRRCSADCPLSPYFPADQPKRFQNVHKLFGVSNILRLLKHVDPSKREDTVKSIAYEADTRDKDPVHGCLGVITVLQHQVSQLKDELAVARDQLFLLQHHHHQAQMQQVASLGSIGGSTSGTSVNVNVSAAQETSPGASLMQRYNGVNQLGSSKRNAPLAVSCFDPDQYLRTDQSNIDVKPARLDIARYNIRDPQHLDYSLTTWMSTFSY